MAFMVRLIDQHLCFPYLSLLQAREHAVREKNLREQATEIIKKANEHSPFLDLHLLSQKDALALLKERLALLDREFSMSLLARIFQMLSF